MITRSLLHFIGFLLSLFGSLGLRIIAFILGIIAFDILQLRKKIILANLDIAFGNTRTRAEKIQIGRKSYVNFLNTALEFFASKRLYPQLTTVARDSAHMENALKKGLGVYNMAIHIGNFELMAAEAAKHWTHVNAVTKPVGKGEFAAWVRRRREENGISEILPGAEKGSRQKEIYKALDRKEIVGFMVDQRRSKGISLPFFGKPAMTNTSLFRLWKSHRAPIVPTLLRRVGISSYEFLFLPEFEVHEDPAWSEEEFLRENTTRMNLVVEEMIRLAPQEYFWLHKRWK